jgi:hypothetical protein
MAGVPPINLALGYGIPLAVVPWSSDIRKERLRCRKGTPGYPLKPFSPGGVVAAA